MELKLRRFGKYVYFKFDFYISFLAFKMILSTNLVQNLYFLQSPRHPITKLKLYAA